MTEDGGGKSDGKSARMHAVMVSGRRDTVTVSGGVCTYSDMSTSL